MGRPKTQPIPSVETRRVRVADLVPAEYNPRKISARAMAGLRASLERFGELGGVVVNDRTGRIVGGHQRVKALAALGVAEVDVRVIDVDAASERAANLALNHSGIGGEWDEEMLSAVLAEVQRDLPTAFDELLLSDLLGGLGDAGKPDDTDDDDKRESLVCRFGVPPFSVLDARQGYWQTRKSKWLDLGIESEIGRGGGGDVDNGRHD